MCIAVVNDCAWHATDRTYLSFDCGILLRNIDAKKFNVPYFQVLCCADYHRGYRWNQIIHSWLAFYVDQNTCAQLQYRLHYDTLELKSNC